jgi:SAM-dependent methyltransferase
MTPGPLAARKYGDADGYDAYMGGWSAALSPRFLDVVRLPPPATVVDVGCGTGNLLAAVAARYPTARLIGVDPSASLLRKARQRPDLGGASFVEGYAESLPLAAGSADGTLSMLVLQEFPDRQGALREMRRVTRPGGVVAACQWDFARMPVIASLIEAIERVNPLAGRKIWTGSPPVFTDPAELLEHWDLAGLDDLDAGRISVSRTFPTFEHLWLPLHAGSTPSTLTLASLAPAEQTAVRDLLARRFAPAEPGGPVTVVAEALVVRGAVP